MTLSQPTPPIDRRLAVAPMMDWTDRHDRYFLRLVAPRALLYTEMVTAPALIHGQAARALRHHGAEHPLALQLGGAEPADLARAVRIAEPFAFDEYNLNCGCPSERVGRGGFGAWLMTEPALAAQCVSAMRSATARPVTVKCRLGVDARDTFDDLRRFIDSVAAAGVAVFVVHARKALLRGLSPRENREIPPLDYERVYCLKAERPDLTIVINGGIRAPEAVAGHLGRVDGVMIGREAYQNPFMLTAIEAAVFGPLAAPITRESIIARLTPYIEAELAAGERLHRIVRHVLGLYRGVPGAQRWRRHLSENANRPGAGPEILQCAADLVRAA
jgi:tRNA-dihydrouridine synthase A